MIYDILYIIYNIHFLGMQCNHTPITLDSTQSVQGWKSDHLDIVRINPESLSAWEETVDIAGFGSDSQETSSSAVHAERCVIIIQIRDGKQDPSMSKKNSETHKLSVFHESFSIQKTRMSPPWLVLNNTMILKHLIDGFIMITFETCLKW